MAITTSSPVIDTTPSFDTNLRAYNTQAYENKIETTTNLTSTPVSGQITDINSIGYETSTPTFDTGFDFNLKSGQNQNTTNYDNIISELVSSSNSVPLETAQALTPTIDSTQTVPSPALDLGLDLANLQSTPITTTNVDTVGTTFGEYQTISPSSETNITTQIPKSSEAGSTFGEYQTTTTTNGIKSRFTPSIEPTPIPAQAPVIVPSTQTITTPKIKRVYVPVKKTIYVPKKQIVYVKSNKRVSIPKQSIPTSTTVIRKSLTTIPQQTTTLTSPYQVTTQTLRASQNPIMTTPTQYTTQTIPIQNVVGTSPTIPGLSLPYTPVIPQTAIPQPIIPQQIQQPIIPQQVQTIIPQQIQQPIIHQPIQRLIIPQQVPQPIIGQMAQPTMDQKAQPFIGQIPQTTVPLIQNQGIVPSPLIQRMAPVQNYGMVKPTTYNVSTYRPKLNRNYSVYNLGRRTNMTRPHLYGSRTYSARKL